MIDLPALRQSHWHPLNGLAIFVQFFAAAIYMPMTVLSIIFAFVCANFVMSDMWTDALKALIYAVAPMVFLYCIRWLQHTLTRISMT